MRDRSQRKLEGRPEVVYIVGAGRSGSTLLDMMLGAHSQIFSLGEVIHLPDYLASNQRCTCRLLIRECPFWTEVTDRLSRRLGVNLADEPQRLTLTVAGSDGSVRGKAGSGFRLGRALVTGGSTLSNKEGDSEGARQIIDNIYQFFDIVRRVSGCPTVVDSTKSPRRVQHLCLERPIARFRVVHLVRDGRAFVHSSMKRSYTIEEPEVGNDPTTMVGKEYHMPSYMTAAQATRMWLGLNLTAMLVQRTLPVASWLRLRYEDLCRDPTAELQRLCHFIGLPYQDTMLDFRSVIYHNVGGNAARFRTEGILPPCEVWRTQMSDGDLRAFGWKAGWLNRYYGYGSKPPMAG